MNIKTIFAFSLGPIGSAVLSVIALPIIAWYYSPEDIGRISLLQTAINLCTIFCCLGLDQAYVREFHESKDKSLLLKSCILPSFFILSLVFLALLTQPGLVSYYLFEYKNNAISFIVLFCFLMAFFIRFLSLILRMQERGFTFSLSQIAPKVIFLLSIIIFAKSYHSHQFEQLLISQTISLCFTFLFFLYSTKDAWMEALKKKLDLQHCLGLIKFAYPLIFGSLAFWGLTATDRVFLRNFSSFEELGIYSVAVSFAGAAIILQSIFSTVWAPIVYRKYSAGADLDKIEKIIRYILLMVMIFFCTAGMFSWVFNLFLPKDYENVKFILTACLGYPLLYTLSETTVVGVNISKKTFYSMLASLLAFLINAVCNYFLVPLYGAAGAAASTAFSFWIFLVLRTEFSILLWKKIKRGQLYAFSFIATAMAILTALYGSIIGWWGPVTWLLLFLFVLIVFFREFHEIASWSRMRINLNRVK
ncbi:lipopolysaccharide biosynthesis protein [Gallaecimonas pentaromativorans]|uniref:O-antigen/teichoic acid export membrane protein n=1 Tax=Gallaecimonas pentaromativorans TaxID=584787 RepID=A0A3N1P251_9GAMM|nr:oligosaccharide flippase family protein [Gallaecimonas pentaromativorans]ROQ22535.1 O-antigen/teichoic acid export membrane protein [Gallaecimonas pentaromativorans]